MSEVHVPGFIMLTLLAPSGYTPVRVRTASSSVEEGRCQATWKREFKLQWRKAGPLKSYRRLSGFGPVAINKEFSLSPHSFLISQQGPRRPLWRQPRGKF